MSQYEHTSERRLTWQNFHRYPSIRRYTKDDETARKMYLFDQDDMVTYEKGKFHTIGDGEDNYCELFQEVSKYIAGEPYVLLFLETVSMAAKDWQEKAKKAMHMKAILNGYSLPVEAWIVAYRESSNYNTAYIKQGRLMRPVGNDQWAEVKEKDRRHYHDIDSFAIHRLHPRKCEWTDEMSPQQFVDNLIATRAKVFAEVKEAVVKRRLTDSQVRDTVTKLIVSTVQKPAPTLPAKTGPGNLLTLDTLRSLVLPTRRRAARRSEGSSKTVQLLLGQDTRN